MMYDELVKNLRDCSEVNSLSRYKRDLMKQAADAIEGLSHAVDQMTEWRKKRWIPVAEQLPEEYGHYLANIEGGEFTQVSWTEIVYFDGKVFRWEHISAEYPEEVTHWMPLPEPPKDGKT